MKLKFFPCISAAAILAVLSLTSRSEVSSKATSSAAAAPIVTLSPHRLFIVCNSEFVRNPPYCNPGAVTLTNAGNTPLKITSINISGGPFLEGNNCGTSVAPGKSCTIEVFFLWWRGSGNGFLILRDNAGTGYQTIYLFGYLV